MAAFNKFDQLVEELAKAGHNLSTCQLRIALSNVLPVRGNSVIGDITEISYINLSSRDVTTVSCEQVLGVLKLIASDLVIAATGAAGPFRYVVIYNSTNNKLIGWWDIGVAVTLANGNNLPLNFSDLDNVLQII